MLFIDKYETIGGTEYFLTFEDKDRIAVFAFLRLRLPTSQGPKELYDLMPEIEGVAFIRELHTYGQLLEIGHIIKTFQPKAGQPLAEKQTDNEVQHRGLGKKLLVEAEKIAKKAGFKKIAVISGVGVRNYYRKSGYKKKGSYMIKKNLTNHH